MCMTEKFGASHIFVQQAKLEYFIYLSNIRIIEIPEEKKGEFDEETVYTHTQTQWNPRKLKQETKSCDLH